MDEKIKAYFKGKYDRIEVPRGLKKKILSKENRGIFVIAAVSASVFVLFLIAAFSEFYPALDNILTNIALP